jgi:multiple sugar transport system permease protein
MAIPIPGGTQVRAQQPVAPRGRASRHEARSASGFLALSMAGFALFTILPIIGSLVMAFFDWPVFGDRSFTGLSNFSTIFTTDPVFRRVLWNTVLFVLLYLPLNIVVSMGLALWISPRVRGRGIYRVMFFLPAVTPMVANAIVWQLLLTPRGVVDSLWKSLTGSDAPNFLGSTTWAMGCVVVMSVWQGFGYNMLVFSAALDAVPASLVEAARVDGAGPVRRYFSVVLPMLSPSLFFAVTMTLITSFQVFIQPYILTGGGPGVSTETLVMYLYRTGFEQFKLGQAAALAWVLFAIIMVVTALQFLLQKRWVHYDR